MTKYFGGEIRGVKLIIMVKLEEPDKGQAWVVAIAVFFVNILVIGMKRMIPLMYVELIATYGVSRQSAAEPFAVAEAIRLLGGKNLFMKQF